MTSSTSHSDGSAGSELPPLPTFVIIGAQKSATRWLRMNLGRHPEVFTATAEISFFNSPRRFRTGGADWYRAQFKGWDGEAIVGEATPGYMMWQHDPAATSKRIKEMIPQAQLIAVLRNPVDRAYSAMVHHINRERLPRRSKLLDLVREDDPESDPFALVSGSWYGRSLAPFRDLFGDQLLVILHDDVVDDPTAAYETAVRHVGATPGFTPPRLDQVRFSNQRSDGDDEGARRPAPLTDNERVALFDYFESDVRQLEALLDRDLSLWDPRRQVAGPAQSAQSR